jgi:hypothetical protein
MSDPQICYSTCVSSKEATNRNQRGEIFLEEGRSIISTVYKTPTRYLENICFDYLQNNRYTPVIGRCDLLQAKTSQGD